WLPNSPAFVAAFLATLRLGAIAAPLGVLLKPREVRARLEIAQPSVLVTTPALARDLGDVAPRVMSVEPTSVEVQGGSRTDTVSRAANDVEVLVFTSGPAGDAKAAELTHRGVAWNARALADGLA